nr:TrbG/VirB9 family P-type conjugative transfer protein [Rickettsia endosymbiont of Cardiosporidium cionae]
MIIVRTVILILILNLRIITCLSYQAVSVTKNTDITVDYRIKKYIYNQDEVYLIVLHSGFQSYIEFEKNEFVKTLTLGDTYSWKITPLDNKLFIKALEKYIKTNMIVITNKRTYQFDLVSKELVEGREQDLVYVIRFSYHEKKKKSYINNSKSIEK